MSPELDKKLCEKYPKIFTNRHKSEVPMSFGFEIGDGWYELIDNLCFALEYTYTSSAPISEEDGKRLGVKPIKFKASDNPIYFYGIKSPQVVADQVKEKYGTLRFYYSLEFDEHTAELAEKYPEIERINNGYANFIRGIVHFAEIASSKICEISGEKGEMHIRNGWFKVLNKELAKTRYKDYVPYASLNSSSSVKNETET